MQSFQCFTFRIASRIRRTVAVGLALTAALPAFAERTTIGPFVDFTGIAVGGASVPYQTKTQIDVLMQFYAYITTSGNPPVSQVFTGFAPTQPITTCVPGSGSGGPAGPFQPFCGSWRFLDAINISNLSVAAVPVPVKGVSYFSYDTADMTGQVRVTTLYGLDLNPAGAQLSVGGIEPGGAALEFANERIIGASGTAHVPSFAARIGVTQLRTVLGSDFDVSAIHGTANATVQVFQTDLLVSEIAAVPEPGTLALFACGLAAVGLTRWRRTVPNGRSA